MGAGIWKLHTAKQKFATKLKKKKINLSRAYIYLFCRAFPRVYTFGRVFRADNNRSKNHLTEFQMVEAELAFVHSLDVLIEVCVSLIAQFEGGSEI